MTSLLHVRPIGNPALRLVEAPSPAIAIVALPETPTSTTAPAPARVHNPFCLGKACRGTHPNDPGRWCLDCLCDRDPFACLAPCESEARYGAACYLTHFGDRKRWCERCLAEVPRGHNLPAWMERARPVEPDAPGEPRLPMADWIEVQASLVRLNGSNLAEWLAGKMDDLAEQVRSLDAETPDQFESRSEVMARDIADWDHEHGNGYGGVAAGADYDRASHGF